MLAKQKKSALKIKFVLDASGNNINKRIVNQLESCFMSLIKGVEQFEDKEAQKKHQEFAKLRYEFLEYIDPFL